MRAQIGCRHFLGDRPCGQPGASSACTSQCPQLDVIQTRVVIIHLGALGAVVRATSLLKAVRAKYQGAHITWVTQAPADQLLRKHPRIDRVLTLSQEDLLRLRSQRFDVALVNDKSLVAAGVLAQLNVKETKGFCSDPVTGAIVPANAAAQELWEIGLDNHRKFFVNEKTEVQLMCEALELPYGSVDGYDLVLSEDERTLARQRRFEWQGRSTSILIGLNTGCANAIPYKKLSVAGHRRLIGEILSQWGDRVQIVLLGGREDVARNEAIADGLPVIKSPMDAGLRDGLISVSACDAIVTGDSLGMHLAIAAGVWTVAWFGPTCSHEIDFFGRGVAVLADVPCSPCWKRSCEKAVMCYDQVDPHAMIRAIAQAPALANRAMESVVL